jgi:REP element-mobilizing transposase RayT
MTATEFPASAGTVARPARRRKAAQLGFAFRTWGGKRRGAGRKPTGERAGVSHRPRADFTRRLPVHVTLRMAPEVYNLRSRRSFRVIAQVLRGGGDRFDVHVVEFSVQGNHIHLLVEAPNGTALARACKGLSVRLARGLNRMMKRKGRVLDDRYHAHVLRTPTEVRRAKTYIRDNARQHAAARGETYSAGYVDPYSSASAALLHEHDLVLPAAQTWLGREGWRR